MTANGGRRTPVLPPAVPDLPRGAARAAGVRAALRALEARLPVRSRRRWYWLAAAVLVVLSAAPEVLHYLVLSPPDQWLVDLDVYREAGASILIGRPVYVTLTEAPQLLPFTYPPFAAVVAIPSALLPFGVLGWVWTVAQLLADTAIVWYAGYPLVRRAGARAPLLLAALTMPLLWMQPVSDGLRFGQVNAFLVLGALMDLRRPRPRLVAWVPAGVLVGLGTAVKLTPGVFIVHYLLNRRWREAAWAIGTAVGVTAACAVLLPGASIAYWGGVLQDGSRLGPNDGPANQSLRGAALRLIGQGGAETAGWLLLVAVVATLGFGIARRAYRQGASTTEVAAVGMMAALLSPIAWVHHYHWVMVVVLVVLGPDPLRHRRRMWAAALVWAWFMVRFLGWAPGLLATGGAARDLGKAMHEAFVVGGLLCVAVLWWVVRLPGTSTESAESAESIESAEACEAAESDESDGALPASQVETGRETAGHPPG